MTIRLGIGTRLHALLGLCLAALIAIGLWTGYHIAGSHRVTELVFNQGFVQLSQAQGSLRAFEKHRGLVGRAPAEMDLDRLAAFEREADRLADGLQDGWGQAIAGHPIGDPARDRLEAITAGFAAYRAAAAKVFAFAGLFAQEDAVAALSGPVEAAAKGVGDQLTALMDEFETSARRQMAAAEDEAQAMLTALLVVIGVFCIAVGAAGWRLSRSIARPIAVLCGVMERLAAGDLAATVPARERRDEIGLMARAVVVFRDQAIEKGRHETAEQERRDRDQQDQRALREREAAIGHDVAALVAAIADGDFSRRIELAGKDGFFRDLGGEINRLTDRMADFVEELAVVLAALAQGDLGCRMTKPRRGALDRIKANLNVTIERLADIVGHIHDTSDAISTAASEVSGGSGDLAHRTEQQATSLEETAASMEQLGAAVRSTTARAQRADRMATDARSAAERGGTVAVSAIDAMRRIDHASRRIADIIGVIDEIAFQTNLLALNAAVEAARAGEAGRGFAVVAQEVRTLAQRSAEASRQIKALIKSSDTEVRDGVEMVGQASQSLSGIARVVTEVAALIREMATASADQTTTLEQVTGMLAEMDQMTQKNAALVEETSAASQALAERAEALQALLRFFRDKAA